MADTAIAITAGTGTNVDTRTEGTNGNHRQVVVLGDPATNAGVAPVDATAGLKVDLGADNDVTVTSGTITTVSTVTSVTAIGTSVTPGTSAAHLGKAEDAAHTSGDTGVAILGVRRDTAASGAGTDGDYATLNLDATGHLYVAIKDSQLGGSEYETVAASQTTQTLGATGATGDYLDTLLIVVTTAATAQVSIKDGADSAIVVFPNSPGAGVGTYPVPVGLVSRTGAWQITTGAGSAVIATGNFT
jgi:hypothetical protein